jgi:hypothetical protein
MTREEQLSKLNEAQAKWTAAVKAEAERTAALATKPPGFNFTAENVVTANAEVTIEFYAIHGHLTAELTFDNGQKMKFDGWPWGIGAAAGKGVGWYYGVPAQILAGGCHYWCQFGGRGRRRHSDYLLARWLWRLGTNQRLCRDRGSWGNWR